MAVTRRTFFKRAAGASAGTAVGALAALGADLQPKVARAQELRIQNAKVFHSVCPYCAVGCAMLVHTVDGQIVNIEGDPASPINYGNLCPKGAAVFQLHVNPNRLTRVLHRKPGGTQWEVVDLTWAMDRVAELTKQARDETFIEKDANGFTVNRCEGIGWAGGCTDTNELNYLAGKAMRSMGVVYYETQARV